MSFHRSLAFLACLSPVLLFGCGGGNTETQPVWQTAQRSDAAPAPLVPAMKATIAATKTLDATTLFDWAESRYPELFPKGPANQTEDPYFYRYYPTNKLYLGAKGDEVLWMGPNTDNKIVSLGKISDYTCFVFPEVCNFAPVANAGAAQNVVAGRTVTLDGSASSDANGDPLTGKSQC